MKIWLDLKAVLGMGLLAVGVFRLVYISFYDLNYVSASLLNLTLFFASAYFFYTSWANKGNLLMDICILLCVPMSVYYSGKNPQEVFNTLMFAVVLIPFFYLVDRASSLIRSQASGVHRD